MTPPASDSSSLNIPLAEPSISDRAVDQICSVVRSSRLSRGPYLEQFEAKMAEQCGTRHAVAVSSGTAALHCIVAALGLSPGAEVITTPFSFVASTNVLLYEDLQPRFVDIDPTTFNIDVEQVEQAITPRTEAILAVDVFGVPANWPALTSLAEAHDLALIADACEALGASIGNRPIGAWGDAAAFGFYPNKQITTGEGGCITTDDPELARTCRSLRNQGRTADGRMRHARLGYNYRLGEMSAALGCAQLDRLDALLGRREAVADRYRDALAPLGDVLQLPPRPSDASRSWFVYVVRLGDPFEAGARDTLMAHLQSNGIGCAPYFPAIHLQPYHRDRLGHAPGAFPVCEQTSARTLALPFFPHLTSDEVRSVADLLQEGLASLSSLPTS
jgi:perosamine synthetase